MTVSVPTQEYKNPVAVEAAFGRLFWAVDSRVYFSRVLKTSKDAGVCYQTNDPVSEDIPDLLDTDGGDFFLDSAINITKIKSFRSGVLVFADNGVWYIYNPDGGFKATAFNVTKVSERGIDSERSVVEAEGGVFYFSASGIVQIIAAEFDNLISEDITEMTIRGYYLDNFLGNSSQGVYDESNKRIIWWNTANNSKGLIFDLSAKAFYPQENAGAWGVVSPIRIQNKVYYPSWRYTTQLEYSLADTTDETFKDFDVDNTAYMVSGWETLGKFANKKSITQAKVFFNKTETQITGFDPSANTYTFDKPSSCLFQARWDFDNSAAYSKWVGVTTNSGGVGKKVQLYNPVQRGFIPDAYPYTFDTGEGVITKKYNVRGNGDAVQFLFEAQPEKDMQLLGYSVSYTMRGRM